MIDHKDSKSVLEVCEAATEGPWEVGFLEITTPNILTSVCDMSRRKNLNKACEDMEFIALARTALPYWVQRAVEAEAENKHLQELIHEQGLKVKEYESNPTVQRNVGLETELAQCKGALKLACDYKLNDSCPSAEENWEPPHKHLCAQCTGSDCIVCWGKYFLAQAKAGDK